MNVKTRKRAELKSFFKKRNIPTEENFSDLIDSFVNYSDDGFIKEEGNPLAIEAVGDSVSQKRTLSFFNSFSDTEASWTFSLNPRADLDDINTANAGLSVSDASKKSRIFIEQNSDNVGIGTVNPKSSLHVQGGGERKNILMLGESDKQHLSLGKNSIAAFESENSASSLYLQGNGGNTYVGGNLVVEGSIEQEDWKNPDFIGYWGNGNDVEVSGYYKDSMGVVHLRGGVLERHPSHGVGYGGDAVSLEILTLPEGYRPSTPRLFTVIAGNSKQSTRLDVSPEGVVFMHNGWNPSRFVSLCGVSFRAEQ